MISGEHQADNSTWQIDIRDGLVDIDMLDFKYSGDGSHRVLIHPIKRSTSPRSPVQPLLNISTFITTGASTMSDSTEDAVEQEQLEGEDPSPWIFFAMFFVFGAIFLGTILYSYAG